MTCSALFGPVAITPSELLASEVEDVMIAVAATSGEPLCVVSPPPSQPPALPGAAPPVAQQPLKALSFSHVCSFLSPEEIAAGLFDA